MARPRPAPEPGRYSPCARCAQAYPPAARWPDGAVCQYCYAAAKRARGSCASCGHDGVLPGLDADGRRTCRACSGIVVNVDCRSCGREDEIHSRGRCWACVLDEQVRTLLAGADGTVPSSLEPVARAIAGMERANSGVTWLRSAGVQALLRGLATGSVPLEQAALDALPASRTVEYIRGLLVENGALPRRDRRVADFERWLTARLATIADPESRQLLERYARWHHLRRLRHQSSTAPVSEAAFERAKQCVTVAGQFLQWLTGAGFNLGQAGQRHVDQWYAEGRSTAVHVETFLYWALEHRLLPPEVAVPRRRRDAPVALGEQERLDALRRILTESETAMPLQVRVLAGLVLLFAQPVGRLTRLTTGDIRTIEEEGGDPVAATTQLRLGRRWCPVPEPFASMLARHLADRGPGTAANPRSDWLFPGVMPGQPITPTTVAGLLVRAGIPALPARAETWRQLARQAPPAVLAELLGAAPATAARHAELAGADYARYAAGKND